jgi:hypothetical protein
MLFIRAQSVIRADGAPSAQVWPPELQVSSHVGRSGKALRAARANPVFGTDEKRIRTKNAVMYKSNYGLRLLLDVS